MRERGLQPKGHRTFHSKSARRGVLVATAPLPRADLSLVLEEMFASTCHRPEPIHFHKTTMGLFNKLRLMPETLAGLTCLCFCCGNIAVIGALVPNRQPIQPAENRISHEELWSSWDGPLLLATGIFMITFSVGVMRRNPLVRYIWPLYFTAIALHAVAARPEQMLEQLLGSGLWILISTWYFFRKPTVVRYFQGC